MNSNFNQQQQQQQQQPQQQLQSGSSMSHSAAGGEERRFGNAGTPPGGFQNTGSYGPQQQHQMMGGNPRTPMGGMGMQSMGYVQMSQPIGYHPQSQGNSPAPSGQGAGSADFVNSTIPSQSHQGSAQQAPHPQKELNVASFCRLGQETVQELVNKMNEMFGCLKATQPPDGKQFPSSSVDRKQKLHEMLRAVKALLKRLRIIYDKMEEVFPSSDTLGEDVQNLIPYLNSEETWDNPVSAERKNTEAYRLAMEEYREVVEQVSLKNRDLKMTIDHLRQTIWEVNTMFAMRKD